MNSEDLLKMAYNRIVFLETALNKIGEGALGVLADTENVKKKIEDDYNRENAGVRQ